MEGYKGLNNAQIALICAKDVISKEIINDWEFNVWVGDKVLELAGTFYEFLENPDAYKDFVASNDDNSDEDK